MRRDAMLLGHPRLTFPLGAEISIQSIGSRAKFRMRVDSIRGWELNVEMNPNRPTGYNPSSLLEIWINDKISGRTIFGFAKFLESSAPNTMLIRIVEIDGENREFLQDLIDQIQPRLEHEIRF